MTFLLAFAMFSAGAARTAVTPDLQKHGPVYLAGFANGRQATGVHDDLWARCLALSDGQRSVVLCGVDSIGLFWDDIQRVRKLVKDKFARAVEVVVCSTHVHQAPDTMGLWGPQPGVTGLNEAYNTHVVERTAAAALAALQGMKPARARLAVDDDEQLKRFFDDTRPPVVHDRSLIALAVDGADGKRIGTLVNWANHPEALGSRNTLITSDYPAALYRRLEELEGGVAVFLNGAVGGMQSPLGAVVEDPATKQPAPKDSFRFAEIIGVEVAERVARALKSARVEPLDRVDYRETLVKLPITNPGFLQAAQLKLYGARKPILDGNATASPVGYLRLSAGGKPVLEAAAVPGELYPELSAGGTERYAGADFPDAPLEAPYKQLMASPYRMLFGLANDEIGYIIPKAEWDEKAPWLKNAPKRWYGEVNSPGPDTASLLLEAWQGLLRGK